MSTTLLAHRALLVEAAGGDAAWAQHVFDTVAVEASGDPGAVPGRRHTAGALALLLDYEETRAQVLVSAAVRNVLGLTRSVPAGHFRRYLDVATRAFLDLQRREGGEEQKDRKQKEKA